MSASASTSAPATTSQFEPKVGVAWIDVITGLNASNAIFKANTPNIDKLYQTSLNTELRTDGEYVGLPKGQMGNSEVGHMNLGAGRIVYQDLAKINRDIENNQINTNPTLLTAINKAKEKNKAIHIMGLLSDAGIHSHSNHLKAI